MKMTDIHTSWSLTPTQVVLSEQASRIVTRAQQAIAQGAHINTPIIGLVPDAVWPDPSDLRRPIIWWVVADINNPQACQECMKQGALLPNTDDPTNDLIDEIIKNHGILLSAMLTAHEDIAWPCCAKDSDNPQKSEQLLEDNLHRLHRHATTLFQSFHDHHSVAIQASPFWAQKIWTSMDANLTPIINETTVSWPQIAPLMTWFIDQGVDMTPTIARWNRRSVGNPMPWMRPALATLAQCLQATQQRHQLHQHMPPCVTRSLPRM